MFVLLNLVAQRKSESLKNFRSIVRFYSNPPKRKRLSKYEKRSAVWRFLKKAYRRIRPFIFAIQFFLAIYFICTTHVTIGFLSGFSATFVIISIFLLVVGILGFFRRAGKSKFIRDKSTQAQMLFVSFFFLFFLYLSFKEFFITGDSTLVEIQIINFRIVKTYWLRWSLKKYFFGMCKNLVLDPNGFEELFIFKNSRTPQQIRERLIELKKLKDGSAGLKDKLLLIVQIYSMIFESVKLIGNSFTHIARFLMYIFKKWRDE